MPSGGRHLFDTSGIKCPYLELTCEKGQSLLDSDKELSELIPCNYSIVKKLITLGSGSQKRIVIDKQGNSEPCVIENVFLS